MATMGWKRSLTFLLLTGIATTLPSFAGAQSIQELRDLIEAQQQSMEAQQQRMEEQAAEMQRMRERLEELEAEQAATREAAETARTQAEELREQPLVRSGTDRVEIEISGQINRMVNVGADGENTKVYNVDNDNSSSRLRFVGRARPNDVITVGTRFEGQFESNSSADVSQLEEDTGTVNFTDRYIDLFIEHAAFGRVSLGQGDTASNGASEIDLSGTTVIANSEISDTAGGLFFFDDDTGEYDETAQIDNVFTNYDGLSRRDRIRYDTPEVAGFVLSADYISDQRWSAALQWGGEFSNFEAGAAAAYSDPGGDRDYIINGSVSILHTPTGFNFTVAAGTRDEVDRDDGVFYYAKLGYKSKLFTFGESRFSIDYNRSEDVAVEGDEADSVGLYMVQVVSDWGMELFGGYRWHALDRDGADFDDVHVFSLGSRVRF